MKTKIVISALIFLFVSGVAFSGDIHFAHEPDGFRSLKWGEPLTGRQDMIYERTDPSYGGIEVYTRKGDKLKIGLATLQKIEYGFWHDQFCGVTVSVSGYTNWAALKEATFQFYGEGYQNNEYVPSFVWVGPVSSAMLEYNQFSQHGTLFISSSKIIKEQREFEAKQAEDATKDF